MNNTFTFKDGTVVKARGFGIYILNKMKDNNILDESYINDKLGISKDRLIQILENNLFPNNSTIAHDVFLIERLINTDASVYLKDYRLYFEMKMKKWDESQNK